MQDVMKDQLTFLPHTYVLLCPTKIFLVKVYAHEYMHPRTSRNFSFLFPPVRCSMVFSSRYNIQHENIGSSDEIN